MKNTYLPYKIAVLSDYTLVNHVDQEGTETGHEAFHSNDHKDKAHKSHHDVIACLTYDRHNLG